MDLRSAARMNHLLLYAFIQALKSPNFSDFFRRNPYLTKIRQSACVAGMFALFVAWLFARNSLFCLFQLLILYFRVFFLSLLFSLGSFFFLSAATKMRQERPNRPIESRARHSSSLLPPGGRSSTGGSNN